MQARDIRQCGNDVACLNRVLDTAVHALHLPRANGLSHVDAEGVVVLLAEKEACHVVSCLVGDAGSLGGEMN